MKALKILLFLCIVSVKSFCQDFNKISVDKNYHTEVAYEFVNEKIIIPVEIEGEQYRFLFDTGAPNFITNNLYNKIKTRFVKSILVSDASNKKDSLNVVVVPKINIGGTHFRNSTAVVSKDSSNFLFGRVGIVKVLAHLLFPTFLELPVICLSEFLVLLPFCRVFVFVQ